MRHLETGQPDPLPYGRGSVGSVVFTNANSVTLSDVADRSSNRRDVRPLAPRANAAPAFLPSPLASLSRTCIPHPARFAWVYGHDHVGRGGPVP